MNWQAGGLIVMAILAVGCSSEELSSPTAAKLKVIGDVYLDFWSAKGTGPANEAELLAHFDKVPPALLGTAQDVNRASLLQSSRDGKPFMVRYGNAIQQIGTQSKEIIAYEALGKDETCLVLYASGQVVCLKKSELAAATSGQGGL